MKKYDMLSEFSKLVTDELIITPLGYTSRELYSLGDRKQNFYLFGSMGMPVPFGLGVALSTSETVFVFEGDGSILMNLGALSTVGTYLPDNLKIIILDNGSYDSTGGQPTATSLKTKLELVGKACGIIDYRVIDNIEEIKETFKWLIEPGTKLVVAKILPGKTKVPRIDISTEDIKERFYNYLNQTNNI